MSGLERLCRRFTGFGGDRAVPEQVAALDALAANGGRDAADAVARIITKGAVQGPDARDCRCHRGASAVPPAG